MNLGGQKIDADLVVGEEGAVTLGDAECLEQRLR